MKAATKSNNPRPLWDLTKEVAPGFIRLTRRGKPVAYVLLASHYDEEDLATMTDPHFWEMIRERRGEGTGIPWEQVKAELAGQLGEPTTVRPSGKSNGAKRGKRNGTTRD